MSAEEWKLQVSYKTPSGDMINVRAQTADELSVLLESIADYSFQVAATQKAVASAYALNPLATTSTTPVIAQQQYSAPTPEGEVPGTSAPTCQHGARKYKSGISSKTGKPYAMWVCPMPQGADQCKPVN